MPKSANKVGRPITVPRRSLYTINLDGDMRRDLDLLAGRMEIPRSSLVRWAVRYLLENPAKVMPSWESDG